MMPRVSPVPSLAALALLGALALLSLACPAAAQAALPDTPPPEFSGTVYVGGLSDLVPFGEPPTSRCQQVLDSARGFNMRRLQFLVSQNWVDEGPLDPPPGFTNISSWCSNDFSLSKYYCFSRFNSTRVSYWSYERNATTGEPLPITAADVRRFSGLLGACLSHATALGFDIAINVHADDGRQASGWRNTLAFDPLEPYGGFSYLDAFMVPIAEAVAAALRPTTSAWVSLQGEMGATVFFHPREWVVVADEVRARLAGAARRVHLGLGINNSKLCGCVLIDIVNYDDYLAQFAPLWPSIEGWFDLDGIREAFSAVDYVGISAYVPQASVNFSACDMEALMRKMDIEFSYYNLTLRELQEDMGLEIHWIEFGIGGGVSQNGDRIATTAIEAAQTPFFGIYTPYSPSLDPWALATPDQPSPVRDYMHYYYQQTRRYLLSGGCEYHVSAVYLWNLASWDVIGLYPFCFDNGTCIPGGYRDPWVVELVRGHNALVAGLPPAVEAGGWALAPALEDGAALGLTLAG